MTPWYFPPKLHGVSCPVQCALNYLTIAAEKKLFGTIVSVFKCMLHVRPPLLRPVGIDIAVTSRHATPRHAQPATHLTFIHSYNARSAPCPMNLPAPQAKHCGNFMPANCGSSDWSSSDGIPTVKQNPMDCPEYRRFGHHSVYNSVPSGLLYRKQMQLRRRISSHWPFIFCS